MPTRWRSAEGHKGSLGAAGPGGGAAWGAELLGTPWGMGETTSYLDLLKIQVG